MAKAKPKAKPKTKSTAKPAGGIFQLKITLVGIEPPIWRRVQVRDLTLGQLHPVLQVCMNWTDSHLHGFVVGRKQYGPPELDLDSVQDEDDLSLSAIVAQHVKHFLYTYDFGDSWDHGIDIESHAAADDKLPHPRCLDGERAGPPEDCGGIPGYEELLKALAAPRKAKNKELLEDFGGSLDPEAFDLDFINKELKALH